MSFISKNLSMVKEKMKVANLKRAKDVRTREPRLVAVSKTKGKELIIEAYQCGQRHFGENYVQEIYEKALDEEILNSCPDIKWHFIGHLQRNKINKLLSIPNLFVIETIDSQKLADALNEGLDKKRDLYKEKLNVFIQVNTSGEEAKSGCEPNEVTQLVKYAINNCKNLNVMGLMTIGKFEKEERNAINPDFQCLIDCAFNICKNLEIDINKFEISMGMSHDFEQAIELGATNVRVGSLIFGSRL